MPSSNQPLAFIDLETTGLGPGTHRIAEIGVVTLEDGQVGEWHSLVNPGRFVAATRSVEGLTEEALSGAPRFGDIASELSQRLKGKLLVAHNARFDYAFLLSEFARVGRAFEAQALCTVMLSRKLYPQAGSHNLDALMARHGLTAEVRHRALPDARLLHQFWQVVTGEFSPRRLWATIEKLLAEPVLPPHLDAGLIHSLPRKPGVYILRDEGKRALRVARARNLQREVRDYFRLDRISAKGAKASYSVRSIDWHVADGELSARLHELALVAKEQPAVDRPAPCSIRLDPSPGGQVAAIVPANELIARGEPLCGLFKSERKARNALARLAASQGLCRRLLGLAGGDCDACGAVAGNCDRKRAQHLVRALTALASLRLPHWPYAGPVCVREGRTVHVCDQWQVIGSAKTASEILDLAQLRPNAFDPAVFGLLVKALPRLATRRLKTLRRATPQDHDPARAF